MKSIKLFRLTTIPQALKVLLRGQHRFMQENGFEVVGVASNGQDLIDVSTSEDIRVVGVDMERHIHVFKDIISLWKLYWLFRREKPIILHSMTAKAGLLSMLAGKMAGVPIRMHTFAGLMFHAKKPLMKKLIITTDKLLCWAATHVYPEGEGVKKEMLSYKITSKPLKVLANGNVNGINPDFFKTTRVSEEQKRILREKLNISTTDFVYIFVGRIVGDKGINELVKSFSKISTLNKTQKTGKIKLLLVGAKEPDLDPLLPETLSVISNNKEIIEVGFQEDVRPFFSISHALVLPSYREGMPNAVIQAGAMELPSIVSDVIGCNEIIINGVNGLIVPPKDIESLEKKLILLYQDHKLYKKLKANCRSLIVNRYDQNTIWNALLEEYHRLLKEKNNKKC